MKSNSEKSTSSAATTFATQATQEPFFGKQGGRGFFEGTKKNNTPIIQAKLTINEPGDIYEQEADKMANQVVQRLTMPDREKGEPLSPGSGQPSAVQTKCDACKQQEEIRRKEEEGPEEQEEIRRQADSASSSAPGDEAGGDFSSRLQASKGGGSPLPESTRTDMESAFGADFSGVRIHTGGEAAGMSKSIHAQAFTHGSDIYFNQGKFDGGSTEGKRLLAHELTHTVQQGKSVEKDPQNGSINRLASPSLQLQHEGENEYPSPSEIEEAIDKIRKFQEIVNDKKLTPEEKKILIRKLDLKPLKPIGPKGLKLEQPKDSIPPLKLIPLEPLKIEPEKDTLNESRPLAANVAGDKTIHSKVNENNLNDQILLQRETGATNAHFHSNITIGRKSEEKIYKKEGDIDLPVNQEIVSYSLKNADLLSEKKDQGENLFKNNHLDEAGLQKIFDYWKYKTELPRSSAKMHLKIAEQNYIEAGGKVEKTDKGYVLSGKPKPTKYIDQNQINDAILTLTASEEALKGADVNVAKNTEIYLPYLTSIVLDYYEYLSEPALLDVYYDQRVESILNGYSTGMEQKALDQLVTSALDEVIPGEYDLLIVNGKASGVVHGESGGKVIHLGFAAFESLKTIKSAIDSGIAWAGLKPSTKPLDPESVMGIEPGAKEEKVAIIQQAIASAVNANKNKLQDVRALHIVQRLTGAPVSGNWDATTVQYIGQWKGEPEKKKSLLKQEKNFQKDETKSAGLSPLAARGVIADADVKTMFMTLRDQKDYTSAITLLIDYYDLHANMEMLKMDNAGTLSTKAGDYPPQETIPPESPSPVHSQKVTGIHYTSQSKIESETKDVLRKPGSFPGAFNTENIEELGPRIMVGTDVFDGDDAFNRVLYTLSHELVHSRQDISENPQLSALKEMNAEKMEVSRQFGSAKLPLAKFSKYVDDFERALHELSHIKLDENPVEAQTGIAILSDILTELELRIAEVYGKRESEDKLIPKLIETSTVNSSNYTTSTTFEIRQISGEEVDNLMWYEILRVAQLAKPFLSGMSNLIAAMAQKPLNGNNFSLQYSSEIATTKGNWNKLGGAYQDSGVPSGLTEKAIKDKTQSFINENSNKEIVKTNQKLLLGNADIYFHNLKDNAAKYFNKWAGPDYLLIWKNWIDNKK